MTNALTTLLETRDWLMLDGATGTNLFDMGLMSGDAPELWNVERPDNIRRLHDGFIEAGSDVILTNSFGGSRYRLKLHGAQDRRLKGYSKGMRQKVLITAALLHNPEVLFFDEPLNGIDANSAMVVKDLLRELAAKGKTILFCSHVLEVVERICTRIVIIAGGRRIAEGTAAEIAARSGAATLEEAFAELTGVRDTGDVTRDFLAALE